ncbi:MAG: hypothetical protein HYW00_00525 [Candidatus Colwellbacteria bacterium]|nr:hypothetical protein [Candidatus Colwellbacteria bacterium]
MHPKQKEVVWTPQLAYAVGLITTDGCLYPDGRHLAFVSSDKDLIKTFKECLVLKNRIVKKRSGYTKQLNSFVIQFGNVTLYRWLIKIGLMPNKSNQLGSLEIPDEFFFDFARGLLDGDGSIRKYYDPIYPKSLRLYVSFTGASLPHLLWLKKKINKLTDTTGFVRKSTRAYRLTFSKKDSINLLNRIYYKSDLPCLNRKYIIAKDFILSPRW